MAGVPRGLASHLLRRSLLPSSIPAVDRSKLLHASFHSSSSSSSSFSSRFFSSPTTSSDLSPRSSKPLSFALAGALSFSFAASSISTAAIAKEPLSPDLLPREVVLYQYEACPFCNKVKSFLDYHDIPYKVVEVNPLSKKEIKWSDYKKVPILTVDGEQLVDSSDIIDKLSHRIHPEKQVLSDDEEKKWRRWVDDHLVHVLSPNIYRNTSEALESFDYITSHDSLDLPGNGKGTVVTERAARPSSSNWECYWIVIQPQEGLLDRHKATRSLPEHSATTGSAIRTFYSHRNIFQPSKE